MLSGVGVVRWEEDELLLFAVTTSGCGHVSEILRGILIPGGKDQMAKS